MSSHRKDAVTVASRPGAQTRDEIDEALRDDRLPVQPGTVIAGKFRVERLLGQGGMGVVASAMHMQLGERVAIKFLRREALDKPDLVARFSREARAAVRIKSEHVARVIDVDTMDTGEPYIVMEYLEGSDLGRLLREQRKLPIEDSVEYIMQACEALAEAHAYGIVHRDIKPENLFLAKRAEDWSFIKVLDFGISKAALTGSPFDDGLQLTQTLSLMGSPLYMSPEQIRRSRHIDHRTDIWSLGIVLHELLTGEPVFRAQTITQLCALVLEEPTPSLCASRPEAPVGLDAVLKRCLEKDPNSRYQNVAELAIALLPFGPKRARLSAERVSSVVRASGMTKLELSVPKTMPPPPGDEVHAIHPTNHAWEDEAGRSLAPGNRRRSYVFAAFAGALAATALGLVIMRATSSKQATPNDVASSHVVADAAAPTTSASASAAPPQVAPPPSDAAASSAVEPSASTSPEHRHSPTSRPAPRRTKDGEPDLGF
jgi:serine/threonine-protein kinase